MKYKLIPIEPSSEEYSSGLRYQVQALKDFDDVKAGDVGGFVSTSYNLSQVGNCWLYNSSKMYATSRMYNNAKMYANTKM